MNTSLQWIKDLVPGLDCTAREYFDAMTLSGTKGETYTEYDRNLKDIVVGQVLSIEKHPNADKLVVCQVDIGKDKPVQIVTGAPNTHVGMKVPVVLPGGKVAGGHDGGPKPENGIEISAGNLRGVDSYGMMCSIEELGSSREFYPDAPENGLYEFPADTKVGADAVEVLGLHDASIEYEITSNRVDCYSVLGIAREAAATFRRPFVPPTVTPTGNSEDIHDYLTVEVRDPKLCPRYTARMVKNIKLGPSPAWMQRRLMGSGIRPINNLVDITNYVMEEYGQPMHAYNYDMIAGHKIIVKRASDGDVFETLDGQERKLDHDILMINDGEKAIGIAGIMGGENSKITDDVKTMVFEAACFDGTNIRLSSKRLGLQTDASGKFDKGLDPNNASAAIDRACQLIEELGAGEVVGGMIDVCFEHREEKRIPFDPEYNNRLLGIHISAEQQLEYFRPLEIRLDEKTNELVCPTFRQDLLRKCDIAEEVARFYGYDKIPTTLPSGEATTGGLPWKLRIENIARQVAEFNGFSQAMTYSFESPKVFDKLKIAADDPLRKAIRIANPLGEDFSIMRTSSVNGMLTSLATNYNRRNKDARLYEIANVYIPKSLPLTEYPDERTELTFGMYGDGDFYDMKGVAEDVFERLGMREQPSYSPKSGKPYLHPGRQANILYHGEVIGYLGEVHPDVADSYGIGERAVIAVLDMPKIDRYANFDYLYRGLAKYPTVTRDISLVVPIPVLAGQIEDTIRKNGGEYLESVKLFDMYAGSQVLEGTKSMAYSIVFRAPDHTLRDAEVQSAMDRILAALKEMNVTLRE
ncbi:MAG: phenylalanine--tRNA ligase subunit beta [Lachnospiraceae bacterium]|jgi:phenylalanyl-tRNA synthetase beta chain